APRKSRRSTSRAPRSRRSGRRSVCRSRQARTSTKAAPKRPSTARSTASTSRRSVKSKIQDSRIKKQVRHRTSFRVSPRPPSIDRRKQEARSKKQAQQAEGGAARPFLNARRRLLGGLNDMFLEIRVPGWTIPIQSGGK